MSQYKEIRSRPWFQDLYINKYASQPYDFTGSKINTEHLNTFALDWIEYIEDSGEIDFILLEQYKEEFIQYSKEHFNAIDQRIRRTIKDLFRKRGTYIPNNRRESVTEQFISLLNLDKCPLWPEHDLKLAMNDPNFRCMQTIERKNAERKNAKRSSNTPPPALSSIPVRARRTQGHLLDRWTRQPG